MPNNKSKFIQIAGMMEIISNEKDLSDNELFLLSYVHYHLFHDYQSISKFVDKLNTSSVSNLEDLKLSIALDQNDRKTVENLFNKKIESDYEFSSYERRLWFEIWMFLYFNPSNAAKVIPDDISIFSPQVILLYFWETKNTEKTLEILDKGGLEEARFLHSLYLGDVENNLSEAIKYLSKNDALEILTKLEYVYRNHADPSLFWATEQKLYSTLGEEELWDAAQFLHALSDTEEIAIELLISLSEKKSWSHALSLKSAAILAAKHNENALLINVYSKIYALAKHPELKGALMLRCGFISEYKLKRYNTAEGFYKKALQYGYRKSLIQQSLLRIYLKRGAYGDIVELAKNKDSSILSHAAPLIASVRLHDYKLAWDLLLDKTSPYTGKLAAVLKKWDELNLIYNVEEPPVNKNVAKLMCSLINVMNNDYESAIDILKTLEENYPKISVLMLQYIYSLLKEEDSFIYYADRFLELFKNKYSRRSILWLIASYFKGKNNVKAAKYISLYLEEGGVFPEFTSKNMEWFEILTTNSDFKPSWFKNILDQIENLLPEYENQRKWNEVIAIYKIKKQLAKDVEKKIAYLLKIARICEDIGKPSEETISYYTEILQLDTENKNALDSLARIYETNEDWDNYIYVIRLYMDKVDDIYTKASLYFKYGSIMETQFNREEEALNYYKMACEISPTSLPAIHGIRDLYLKKENWNGVLNTLKMEASIWDDKKEKAGIYAQMGKILYEKLNKKQQAIRYLEAALGLKKDLSSANKYLFKIYFDKKEWKKATDLVSKFNSKVFNDGTARERAEFYYEVGIAFLHIEDHIEAAKSFISAVETDSSYIVPLKDFLKLFNKYYQLPEYSDFLEELDNTCKKHNNKEAMALINVAKAKILLIKNDAQKALDLYIEILEQLPCFFEATEGKSELLLYLGKEQEAYETWEMYINDCQNETNLQTAYLKMMRFVDLKLNKPRKAMIILRKLLELQHNYVEGLYELSCMLYATGQIKEALVTTDRLVNLVSKDNYKHKWKIITKAALFYEEVGETIKTDKLLKNADFSNLDSNDIINICFILVNRRKFDSALNLIDKYLSKKTKNADWMNIHKALILFIKGNKETAFEILNKMNYSTEALELLVDIGRTKINLKINDYLIALLPVHFNNPAYLQILAKSIPPKEQRRRRVRQIHSIFSPTENIPYRTYPLLKNNALSSETFRRNIGVLSEIGPVNQMWMALKDALEAKFPSNEPALEEARMAKGPELMGWQEIEATLGVVGELWVADLESQNMLILNNHKDQVYQIVVKPDIFDFSISTIRFLLGRALEAARSNFSLLLRITQLQRREIADIMYDMAVPPQERDEVAKKIHQSLDRRAQRAVDRITEATWDIFPEINIMGWFEHIDLCLDKVGLLISGDPIAAFQGSAYLINKYNMLQTEDPLINYSLAPRTDSLIISYISEEWDEYLNIEQFEPPN